MHLPISLWHFFYSLPTFFLYTLVESRDTDGAAEDKSDRAPIASNSGEESAKASARELLKTVDRQNKSLSASLSGSLPIKVAWGSKPVPEPEPLSLTMPLSQPDKEEPPALYPERPNCLSHFSSLHTSSQAALRLYAPGEGQEGLKLDAVLG